MEHEPERERLLLVGLRLPRQERFSAEDTLEELAQLGETAEGEIVGRCLYTARTIRAATWLSKGRLEELKRTVEESRADTVVMDAELSPAQQRNLEKHLETKVIDRTALILDIFARHAHSREGCLQVELAQLRYRLPRLTRMWEHLSRLGGGIGTRGPGETQLEVDRRTIRRRIARMTAEIENLRRHRALHRQRRKATLTPTVALVGYTNAGKSTLLNALTGADALVQDQLFATLDPLTRRLELPRSGLTILLTDTVGFIRNLPHQLVAAFKATLEEVEEADLLLRVVDCSQPLWRDRAAVVQDVLDEIGAAQRPYILVLNKAENLAPADRQSAIRAARGRFNDAQDILCISARTGEGIPELVRTIERFFLDRRVRAVLEIPLSDGAALAQIKAEARILRQEYDEHTAWIEAEAPPHVIGRLRRYLAAVPRPREETNRLSGEGSQEDPEEG
jgi:GTP-binding protein HflX